MKKTQSPKRVGELTKEIRLWLIQQFRPGQALPSDRYLSKEFSVSTVTVCKAMQHLVAEGLVERRPGSGTYLLDRQSNLPVGLVTGINILHPNTSQYWIRLTGELRDLIWEEKIPQELFIGHALSGDHNPYHELPGEFIDAVDNLRLRGVIMINANPEPEFLERLNSMRVPILAGNKRYPYSVVPSQAEAMRQAIRHLYAQGRRRFAIITRAQDNLKNPSPENYLELFQQTLSELGLETRKQWLALTDHPAFPGTGWEEARDIWIANPSERPDALIITDEMVFSNASIALLEMGVDIPNELHVVTQMTQSAIRRLPFPVSRIETDYQAIARTMVEMLKTILDGGEPKEAHVTIHSKLQMIEGVAAPRKHSISQEVVNK